MFDSHDEHRIRTFVTGLFILAASLIAVPCVGAQRLTITPRQGLVDEPLSIVVDGLTPGRQFVVRAVMRPNAQLTLASYGHFSADEKGQADIEKQNPLAGTYERGEMGLLWSMNKDAVPERFKDSDLPFPASVNDPYTVLFELEIDGHIAVATRVLRSFARADVQTVDVHQNGLVARLFLPSVKTKVPAVVLLGGSEGGLGSVERGMLLASHGYAALSVAYFREKGLSDQLALIPVETIQLALNYLSRLPAVDARRIGIMGASRGSELALLAASSFPQIKAVIAFSPSNAALAAIVSGPQQAAWTLRGQPVPFVPNPSLELIAGFKQMTAGLPPRGLLALILSYSHAVQRAEIPVERINGPILLVSGVDDRLWPSAAMADLVVTRSNERGSRYPVEHLSFKDAGHIIALPFLPTSTRIQLGGTVTGLAHADVESWKAVLAFLARSLQSPASGHKHKAEH